MVSYKENEKLISKKERDEKKGKKKRQIWGLIVDLFVTYSKVVMGQLVRSE